MPVWTRGAGGYQENQGAASQPVADDGDSKAVAVVTAVRAL